MAVSEEGCGNNFVYFQRLLNEEEEIKFKEKKRYIWVDMSQNES